MVNVNASIPHPEAYFDVVADSPAMRDSGGFAQNVSCKWPAEWAGKSKGIASAVTDSGDDHGHDELYCRDGGW